MYNIQHEFSEIDEGSSNQVILDLLKYIEEELPNFTNSPEFSDILKKKKMRINILYLSAYIWQTNQNPNISSSVKTPKKGAIKLIWGFIKEVF